MDFLTNCISSEMQTQSQHSNILAALFPSPALSPGRWSGIKSEPDAYFITLKNTSAEGLTPDTAAPLRPTGVST